MSETNQTSSKNVVELKKLEKGLSLSLDFLVIDVHGQRNMILLHQEQIYCLTSWRNSASWTKFFFAWITYKFKIEYYESAHKQVLLRPLLLFVRKKYSSWRMEETDHNQGLFVFNISTFFFKFQMEKKCDDTWNWIAAVLPQFHEGGF